VDSSELPWSEVASLIIVLPLLAGRPRRAALAQDDRAALSANGLSAPISELDWGPMKIRTPSFARAVEPIERAGGVEAGVLDPEADPGSASPGR
jgi:hypothetical protein